ncbi:hypothetical protein Gotur_004462 [Gossypium turneri]
MEEVIQIDVAMTIHHLEVSGLVSYHRLLQEVWLCVLGVFGRPQVQARTWENFVKCWCKGGSVFESWCGHYFCSCIQESLRGTKNLSSGFSGEFDGEK